MRTAGKILTAIMFLTFTAAVQAVGGEGLIASSGQTAWTGWQLRVSIGSTAQDWRVGAGIGPQADGLKPDRFSLMGDYYFGTAWVPAGIAGGFRATSGLVVSPSLRRWVDQPGMGAGHAISLGGGYLAPTAPRSLNAGSLNSAALPYVGIGYTGLSEDGGWSFSADLGVMGQAGAVRFGPAFGRSQVLDAAIRDLRFAPLLQFGVSYSF